MTAKYTNEEIWGHYRSGNEARVKLAKEQLLEQYSDFIYYMIRRHFPTYAKTEEEDLFQAGVVGLLTAMPGFNLRNSFLTYSKRYLLHEMSEYIRQMECHCSVHHQNQQRKIRKAEERLRSAGKEVSVEALAQATKLSARVVKNELWCMDVTLVSWEALAE